MSGLQAPLASVKKFDKKHYNKICLVDADFLKYYATNDIVKHWDNAGDPADKYGPDYLMHFVQKHMDAMLFDRFSCWTFIFCFSGSSNDIFRYDCAQQKEYKGNRKVNEASYPNQFIDAAKVISCVARNNPVLIYPWLEADDLLSALQNQHTMIYSHDKDLLQVPGSHYDIKENKVKLVTDDEALFSIAEQLLLGDNSTDNIPGIPGMGPVKVAEYLAPVLPEDLITAVFEKYLHEFGDREGADRFSESWNLLGLRMNYGEWFNKRIAHSIGLRDSIIANH